MKFLKNTFVLALVLAGLATWGCAAGGGPLWDPDHRSDNDHDWDNDNDWDDDDWRDRRGDWDDSRDGDWEDRRYPRSTDRREDYWDDRNSGTGDDVNSDEYWTWGTQSYAVPRAAEMTNIRTISQTLDRSAGDLMEELRRDSRLADTLGRPGGPADKMQVSAESFRAQVEANMNRPDRTLETYQEVKSSHTRLTEVAARRDLNDRVEQIADRIDESVFALDRLYLRARR